MNCSQVWSNSLRRLPSAFLWLTRVSVRKDTSLYAQDNLQSEAAGLGVHAERLAFSFRFPQVAARLELTQPRALSMCLRLSPA